MMENNPEFEDALKRLKDGTETLESRHIIMMALEAEAIETERLIQEREAEKRASKIRHQKHLVMSVSPEDSIVYLNDYRVASFDHEVPPDRALEMTIEELAELLAERIRLAYPKDDGNVHFVKDYDELSG